MRKLCSIGLVSLCDLVAHAALAQTEDAGTLPLEAVSPSNDEAVFGLLGSGLYLFAFLLALIVAVAALSGFRKQAPEETPASDAARNLFLAFRFHKGQSGGDVTAHLRALDLHAATFVSPCPLQRGDQLRLYVGSLPDYPEHNAAIDAAVTSCIPLGGAPETYLVKARFQPPAHLIQKSCLPRYLRNLTRPSQFSHA